MSDAKIFGNITDAYLNQARGRPTVCFAVSIKHSLALVEEFKSKGVTAEHIEAGTSAEERRNALSRLESGATEVISNVGILTTGVDMPYVSAIILARPTKSYNLFIQMLGRGTRTFSGKKNFLVLDHGNNVMEHGFIEDEMQCDLDGVSKPEKSERIITCKECYLIFSFEENQYVCPECGHDNTPPKRMGGERTFATDEDYSMVELSIDSVYNQKIVNNFVSKMIGVAIKRNLKPGWVYHQLKKTHGEFAANKNWQRIKQLVEGAQRSSR
jgi:DNA repair protein RadD